MESLSQGDSSANSSDPDDELGPAYINESGLARILGRMTGYAAEVSASKPDRTITSGYAVHPGAIKSQLESNHRMRPLLPLVRHTTTNHEFDV